MLNRLDQYLRSEGFLPWVWLWIPYLILITGVALSFGLLLIRGSWFGRGIVITGIIIWLWFMILIAPRGRQPASEPCRLRRGNRYRVIKAFCAGRDAFRREQGLLEGQCLIFQDDGGFDAAYYESTGPDYDEYTFYAVESARSLTIRSHEAPHVNDWVLYLEHVCEEHNKLYAYYDLANSTMVVGHVETPEGAPLRRAKVTLSHDGRVLTGCRTRPDGSFDLCADNTPSVGFVKVRVVKDGLEPFETEVKANCAYRAPRLVLTVGEKDQRREGKRCQDRS
jgi:hypothetical protein